MKNPKIQDISDPDPLKRSKKRMPLAQLLTNQEHLIAALSVFEFMSPRWVLAGHGNPYLEKDDVNLNDVTIYFRIDCIIALHSNASY